MGGFSLAVMGGSSGWDATRLENIDGFVGHVIAHGCSSRESLEVQLLLQGNQLVRDLQSSPFLFPFSNFLVEY